MVGMGDHRRTGRPRRQPAAAVPTPWSGPRPGGRWWPWSRARPGSARPPWCAEFLGGADAAVLAGTCVPVAGEPLPYAALTQALRRARRLRRGPPGAVPLAGAGPPAARAAPAGDQPTRPAPRASSRLRLYQSVLGLLDRMGAGEPGRARRRGRALGRPGHPGPAGVPGHEPGRRAGDAAADLPRPRRWPTTDAARHLAGRAGQAARHRAAAARPAGPRPGHHAGHPPAGRRRRRRRSWRPRWNARPGTRSSSSSSCSPATGPARCRPPCTTCCAPGSRGCPTGPARCCGRPR